MDMANHPVAAIVQGGANPLHRMDDEALFASPIPDPEPGWATLHPDRALLLLFVSPRPCAAMDELMALQA